MKLLIVEDSAIVAERLVEFLGEVPGLEIAGSARDVDGTVELVERTDPDVMVLDLRIGGGTSLEVLRAVKARTRAIAVIVLTNSALEPFRQACLEAGADYFLDKSNEFERLPALLAQISTEPGRALRPGLGPSTLPEPERPQEFAPSTGPRRRTGTG